MQYSITYAKKHLSALIAAAERGEDIIITRRGRPVARLVAFRAKLPELKTGSADDATGDHTDITGSLQEGDGTGGSKSRQA
ncbi:type II toxin-antitoxin system Phd/YefM family antitoxin [Roseovarius sp. Pro17]|uniref:type II toxin-antitoxin system Phd/YefM family antitoxin n=1 Tax=Roseovarius sp. Pro17 TaxID=3108175 RepID=UPI003A7F4F58